MRATDTEGTGAWSDSGTAITQYTTQTRSIAESAKTSAAGQHRARDPVDADSNPNGYTLSLRPERNRRCQLSKLPPARGR